MALFLALAELAEVAVEEYAVVASAQAVEIEMATVAEGTPLLSASGLASEEATAAYGSVARAEQTYEVVSGANRVFAAVAGAAVTAEKVWDSARKVTGKRKREHQDAPPRKRLHFDSIDHSHVHRIGNPAKSAGYLGFPNTYTSMIHSFRPVVTC